MPIHIGIVDDHAVVTESLATLLQTNPDFKVVLTASSGIDLQNKLPLHKHKIDIMLVDINMPHMNGWQTASWIKKNYPVVKIVALSMRDDELAIINMIGAGCCAYLTKDIHADELEKAIYAIQAVGSYRGDKIAANADKLEPTKDKISSLKISESELIFLQLACSDRTYVEIAQTMHVTERTIDSYRERLFAKFKVSSRVGLCIEALHLGIVEYKGKES